MSAVYAAALARLGRNVREQRGPAMTRRELAGRCRWLAEDDIEAIEDGVYPDLTVEEVFDLADALKVDPASLFAVGGGAPVPCSIRVGGDGAQALMRGVEADVRLAGSARYACVLDVRRVGSSKRRDGRGSLFYLDADVSAALRG